MGIKLNLRRSPSRACAGTKSFSREPGLKQQPNSQVWCQRLERKRIKNKTKYRHRFPGLIFFSFDCSGFIHEWVTSSCLGSQNNFHLILCLGWMNWNSSLLSLKSYYSSVGEPGLRGYKDQSLTTGFREWSKAKTVTSHPLEGNERFQNNWHPISKIRTEKSWALGKKKLAHESQKTENSVTLEIRCAMCLSVPTRRLANGSCVTSIHKHCKDAPQASLPFLSYW